MRKRAVAVAALGILAAVSSCRRTLSTNATDARSDGTPSVGDGASFDIRVVDAPAIDGEAEAAGERGGDAIDAAEAGVSVCPAGVRPLSVCGCGCCSGVAEGTACYYPSL